MVSSRDPHRAARVRELEGCHEGRCGLLDDYVINPTNCERSRLAPSPLFCTPTESSSFLVLRFCSCNFVPCGIRVFASSYEYHGSRWQCAFCSVSRAESRATPLRTGQIVLALKRIHDRQCSILIPLDQQETGRTTSC